MAKKKEKVAAKEETVQAVEGDDEEVGDDNSPEAYSVSGDFVVDFNEICKRSDIQPMLLKPRAQTPLQSATETETGPVTYVTKDKFEYMKPCIEIEHDDENKSSIKSMFIKGWRIDIPLLNVLSLAAPQYLTTISLWRCGLDKDLLNTLITMISKLTVKTLNLDGNPQCASYFHMLLSEESTISSLSLRCNRITCEDMIPIAAALPNNKSLTNLSLYNNKIADLGVSHLAKGLRMNRTILTLNLGNNKISDVGAKSIAEILTTLTLSHEEIVSRRKIISENKITMMIDDPPTTPGGRNKDRPGSNSRTGSHTTLDKNKNKGASGKGGKGGKDKLDKPGTKDGRKSEQGNKAKDDKRKGGGGADTKSKSKAKGTTGKKNQEEKEHETPQPEIVEFQNPLLEPNETEVDGQVIVAGNYALTCLNLNNNDISNQGITSLYKALHFQENRVMKRGVRGLLRLTLKNNKYDADHKYAVELSDLMMRRDPFYEQPLIEEEQSNITSNM